MGYESTLHLTRKAAAAANGPHRVAMSIDVLAPTLNPGDRVEILANGQQAVVKEKGDHGWLLEGVQGWFPAKTLKKLP